MRLCFAGFENAIELRTDSVVTLEVHNRVMFRNVCESLMLGEGVDAVEAYTLWDGDIELRPFGQFMFVADPLNLPWQDKDLSNAAANKIERFLLEDESARMALEEMTASVELLIQRLALQMSSDYGFTLNWDLKRYLKYFGFGIDVMSDDSLFDKLIKFLRLAEDAGLKRTLAFVNLKLFLSEKELVQVFDQAVFSGLSLMLLENVADESEYPLECKYVIDQDFLEHNLLNQAECPSFYSGDFAPSVLAQ